MEDDPHVLTEAKGPRVVLKCTQKKQSGGKELSSRMLKQFALCLGRRLWDKQT